MFVLLCIIILCAYAWLKLRRRETKHELPPVLPGKWPIIGHLHLLLIDTKKLWRNFKIHSKICNNLGGVIYAIFAGDIYYMITDPEDATTAVNASPNKHFVFDFAKNWLGEGLITAQAEIHRRHRKLLNPGFTMAVMHGFLDVFNSQARELTMSLEPYVNQTTDPLPHFKKVVLKTSCLTTFGSKIKNEEFIDKFAAAADDMMHLIIQRFQKFYLQSDLLYKLLGYQKRENAVVRTLDTLTNEAIKKNKENMINGNVDDKICDITDEDVTYKPFIDLLLELSLKGLLTEEEVRAQIATNIAASFETTAYTLLIVTVLLGSYPEVQERMYQEIMEVLGAERDVDKDDLPYLSYTRAVIKESLRYIPTVPFVIRKVDAEVQLKNYTMRANSQLLILVPGLHRNENWGDDADQFKPERWLDTTVPPKNFAAFGIGRRACIGMRFSLTTLSVYLAHLVREYRWTADVTKLSLKLDVTLKPISGSEICLQRRSK